MILCIPNLSIQSNALPTSPYNEQLPMYPDMHESKKVSSSSYMYLPCSIVCVRVWIAYPKRRATKRFQLLPLSFAQAEDLDGGGEQGLLRAGVDLGEIALPSGPDVELGLHHRRSVAEPRRGLVLPCFRHNNNNVPTHEKE